MHAALVFQTGGEPWCKQMRFTSTVCGLNFAQRCGCDISFYRNEYLGWREHKLALLLVSLLSVPDWIAVITQVSSGQQIFLVFCSSKPDSSSACDGISVYKQVAKKANLSWMAKDAWMSSTSSCFSIGVWACARPAAKWDLSSSPTTRRAEQAESRRQFRSQFSWTSALLSACLEAHKVMQKQVGNGWKSSTSRAQTWCTWSNVANHIISSEAVPKLQIRRASDVQAAILVTGLDLPGDIVFGSEYLRFGFDNTWRYRSGRVDASLKRTKRRRVPRRLRHVLRLSSQRRNFPLCKD